LTILSLTLDDQEQLRDPSQAAQWIAERLHLVADEIASLRPMREGTHAIFDLDRKVVGSFDFTPSASDPG
jgi:hypothetical protein